MITNGVVSIEDGTKAAEEYAPARKVKVEFSFVVPEGGDATLAANLASEAADAKVNELLGRSSKAVPEKPATTRKPREAKEPATVETSAPGSDKAALEAAAGLKLAEEKKPEPKQPEPVEDNIDDLLGDQAPVPITDAELAKAAQNKNAQMKVKDPNFSVKIRALVVEFAGQPPKKITDVPAAKRQEFLDKLRDLA